MFKAVLLHRDPSGKHGRVSINGIQHDVDFLNGASNDLFPHDRICVLQPNEGLSDLASARLRVQIRPKLIYSCGE